MERLELWKLPPELPTPKKKILILYHGSGYILEGRNGTRYRAIRMTLETAQVFDRVGRAFFYLAETKADSPQRP